MTLGDHVRNRLFLWATILGAAAVPAPAQDSRAALKDWRPVYEGAPLRGLPPTRQPDSPSGRNADEIIAASWNGDRLLVSGTVVDACVTVRTAVDERSTASRPMVAPTRGRSVFAGDALCDLGGRTDLPPAAKTGYLFGARRAPVAAVRVEGVGLRVLHGEDFGGVVSIADSGSLWDGLAVSDDGGRIARMTRDDDGQTAVECLDAMSGRRIWKTDVGRARASNEIRFSPDGRFVGAVAGGFVLGAASEGVVYIDQTGRIVGNDPGGPANSNPGSDTGAFAFSPDGRFAVSAHYSGQIVVRDLVRGERVREFTAPRDTYSHFAKVRAAPDGERFALFFPERKLIYVASVAQGILPEGRLETPRPWSDGAFDFLGEEALAIIEHEGVAVRSLRNCALIATIPGPAAIVRASRDGRRLAVVDGARLRIFVR